MKPSLECTATGAGVFGPGILYSNPLGIYFPSVFQAEVKTIERCALFFLNQRYQSKENAILSDNQAAIKAHGMMVPMQADARTYRCYGFQDTLVQ